ncbi:hypothetical protein Peur_004004 [Populus x canadensis]
MEPGIDIEEQPESPLLIAMKGHSSSNKSKIAHELAQLVELASFTGARLVFVECSNRNDQDLDYYDVGNVPKLNIDTTKPFHAEDFITGMLKAAALI